MTTDLHRDEGVSGCSYQPQGIEYTRNVLSLFFLTSTISPTGTNLDENTIMECRDCGMSSATHTTYICRESITNTRDGDMLYKQSRQQTSVWSLDKEL
jgi:hypothetical protein